MSMESEAYKELIQELQCTDNNNRRNEIALCLSDNKCDSAVPVLIELIRELQYTDSIGTLIYALGNLDCANYLNSILHIIFHGNWEASNNLLLVFKEKYSDMNDDVKSECKKIFLQEKERAEDTIEMIEDTLNVIMKGDSLYEHTEIN